MTPEPTITGGALAACIGITVLILAFLAGAWFLRRAVRRGWVNKDDRGIALGLTIACLIGAIVSAVGLWWGMYPWRWEYHEWRPITGTVATVDSRLVPAGESSMEDKFVVTFQDSPEKQYGVLDTRAAAVRPGDRLTITCVRRWQWSGTHGYDCNFIALDHP